MPGRGRGGSGGRGGNNGNGGGTAPTPSEGKEAIRERANRDRFLEGMLSITGSQIEVERGDGQVFKGLFHTISSVADPDYSFVLKAAKNEAEDLFGYTTLLMGGDDVVQIKIPSIVLREQLPAGAGSFATDTDISGKSAEHLAGRDLTAVSSAWLDKDLASDSLESSKSNGEKWDQFEANEKITGRAATYDESVYTTTIDFSKISGAMSEKAQAVADEIEAGEADGNIHVAQERGQVVDTGGLTEEDLHSGVLRTDAEVQQAMGDSANGATAAEKPKAEAATTKKPFKFNPGAKEFKLSAKAPEWKPAPAAAPAMPSQQDQSGAPQYPMGASTGMPYGGSMPYGAGANDGNFNQMQMAQNMYPGQMYANTMPGGPRPQLIPFPGNMAAQPRGAVPYQQQLPMGFPQQRMIMPSAGVYPAGGNMMPYGVMPGMSPRGMPGTGGDAGLGMDGDANQSGGKSSKRKPKSKGSGSGGQANKGSGGGAGAGGGNFGGVVGGAQNRPPPPP